MSDAEMKELLNFDPLATAERITGLSVSDGDLGFSAGFAMMQHHSSQKRQLQESMNDTMLTNTLDRYVSIIMDAGFEQVLCVPFTARDSPEEFYIYAHRDGFLLAFDTYNTTSVNSGYLYYNWEPYSDTDVWDCISSGGMCRDEERRVWIGNHDCRESLIFNINQLKEKGSILPKWIERPSLWLLHYRDYQDDNYNELPYDRDMINAERIAQLPDWVQEMITPSDD